MFAAASGVSTRMGIGDDTDGFADSRSDFSFNLFVVGEQCISSFFAYESASWALKGLRSGTPVSAPITVESRTSTYQMR